MTLLEQALDHLERVLEPLVAGEAVIRHEIRLEEAARFSRAARRTLRATLYEERFHQP